MKVSNPSFIYSLDETLGHDDREEAIVDEIRSFERLPAGWHYGEGHGATGLAVESALAMQALLMTNKADEVEVFPDVSGGVLLSGYCQDETMEIFCDHDGRINIIHEVGGEIAYEKDDVSAQEVNEYMRELLWKFMTWRSVKSSDYFIQSTSARQGEDLQVWRSRIPQRTVASRSLIPDVLESIVDQNANIYRLSTIPRFQGNQQYSGG